MTIAAPAPGTVTMFTTSWCGYCTRLKAQMGREGINYTEVNIEEHPQSAEFVMKVNGGNQTVPTVVLPDGRQLAVLLMPAFHAAQGEIGFDQGNEFGFSALPYGDRDNYGDFRSFSYYCNWWSSTENHPITARYRFLVNGNTEIMRSYNVKNCGLSVRCVKD